MVFLPTRLRPVPDLSPVLVRGTLHHVRPDTGDFAERFDGFSIGSNDLTQLVLGVDRDSAELAELFDERNEAVKNVVRDVIRAAHKARCKVGICGEAPSDYPEFAEFLVESGIDSISINPDRFLETKKSVAQVESGKKRLIRKK